jgi:hypothetical protein
VIFLSTIKNIFSGLAPEYSENCCPGSGQYQVKTKRKTIIADFFSSICTSKIKIKNRRRVKLLSLFYDMPK